MKYARIFSLVFLVLLTRCTSERTKLTHFPQRWHYDTPTPVAFDNLKDQGVKVIKFRVDSIIGGGARVGDTVYLPPLRDIPLGPHEIFFYITYPDGHREVIRKKFTLYARKPPARWKYRIVAEYPHDIHAFTQGLEFSGDTLYESTGLYGKSSVRKTDFRTGRILKKKNFESDIFAEGLTLWGDSVLVLTWQNGKGFILDRKFNRLGEFPYGKSKEGWGLCHNDRVIYKSDGTEKIWILDPRTLEEKDYFNVYAYQNKIKRINELEWVEGKIYTNIWQKNALAVINPDTGEVEAVIDLSELVKRVKHHPDLDVLNGIAYHKERGTLFVTGKNWDKIFELEILRPEPVPPPRPFSLKP
ncbi:MAG: glutaminyl-peptide cyclotransferase [Chlorobi bacterium]|nr:glutaminyl-peptide cyclotransferase [Chlorobiota bacterium]